MYSSIHPLPVLRERRVAVKYRGNLLSKVGWEWHHYALQPPVEFEEKIQIVRRGKLGNALNYDVNPALGVVPERVAVAIG
jgi:hypothetical protein